MINIAARTDMDVDMRNKELIAELAKRTGWASKEVSGLLLEFTSLIGSRLMDNDTVYLQGLGQFEVRKKAERISVNPANGKRATGPR